MNEIIGYLRNYVRSVNLFVFLYTTLFMAVLIVLNYTVGIEWRLYAITSWPLQWLGFFLLFAFVFCTAWLFYFLHSENPLTGKRDFVVLLLVAPAIFAAKVSFAQAAQLISNQFAEPWNLYWNKVLDWPLKCVLVLIMVIMVWKWARMEKPVAGMQGRGFPVKPYLLLLAGMVPLIAFAATRPDFLHTYPKVQRIDFIDQHVHNAAPWKLLYELSYGVDFLTIEFFFRGFVVLLFARFVGKDAILPMAAFYCSIHFGKPLFECITSYFGGIILGSVVYNTRSIWGGLIVHLGVAWLMELGGWLGHLYQATV